MCGVAAAIGVRDAARVAAAMSARLAHRGPDGAGALTLRTPGGGLAGALAHRRLAIIDVGPGGHQPMTRSGGRFAVAFNGEIYNYRALRAELDRDGTPVQGNGDTAVLLAAWERFGAAAVDRLDGMYAFALWDDVEQRLYLARDPFGIKPLYLAGAGEGAIVASEVRALLASGCLGARLDREGIASFLATGSVTEPGTIVRGVRAVPAGAVLRLEPATGGVRVVQVRSTSPIEVHADGVVRDRAVAPRLVRDALERSVARHLVSDVPVGVFLSGGIDSSAVAALAARESARPLDSFTVTFPERQFDEGAVARLVAERIGTRHHEVPLGGGDLLAALPEAFAAMDQPSLDGMNTYVVSRAVRAHGVTVVLSGLGGDELFAGYPSFRRARTLARWARLPAGVRVAAARVAERAGGVRGAKMALGLRWTSPADAAYIASRALFGERQVAALCGQAARERLGPLPEALSLLQRVSWRELTGYMRNTLLRDSDVFAMAHGLELRVPFVDRAVASAAFTIGDELKLGLGAPKPVLVSALRDLLPAQVLDRPKQGFVLPFARWMRGALHDDMAAVFGAGVLADLGIAPTAARSVWDAFRARSGGITWSRPWALYTLARWAATHGFIEPALAGPERLEAAVP